MEKGRGGTLNQCSSMDIHDIDIEYISLLIIAFLGRPYRTFLDEAAFYSLG